MALVECMECGGNVSTIADSCPHCGAVYDFGANVLEEDNETSPASVDLDFTCPNCSTELTAGSSFSGQEFECPDCGGNVTVPQNPDVRIEGNPSQVSTYDPSPTPSRQLDLDGRQGSSGLRPCHACGYNISTEAKSCQHCGAPTPKAMVRGPAIALIILSLFYLVGLGYHNGLHWPSWKPPNINPEGVPVYTGYDLAELEKKYGESTQEKASRITTMILGPTLLIIHSIIFLSAVSMLRMRSYKWAKFGAVLSVIPISSACFVVGIPFGIWALAALNKPETKVAYNESGQQKWLKTNVSTLAMASARTLPTPLLCLLIAGIFFAVGFWIGIERPSSLKSRHEAFKALFPSKPNPIDEDDHDPEAEPEADPEGEDE